MAASDSTGIQETVRSVDVDATKAKRSYNVASEVKNMGAVKEQILHEQDQWTEATRIAVDAGVLKRCPYHDYVYDPLNGDNTPAYKLGNYRLAHGMLEVGFAGSRELTDTIKAVVEDSPTECGYCAKD